MLDLGWTEILLIAVITLIVVGPKELPNVLRTVSYWIRRARGLARDFQKGVDDIVREAELDDIKKELKDVSSGDMSARIENAVDPTGEIKGAFKMDESVAPETPKTVNPAAPKIESPAAEAAETSPSDTPDTGPDEGKAPSPTTKTGASA
ncbi:MAG: twin-arginine translocase subunit TatB [Rhodospirillaceae bacterium]|jgi:sec-independent protein translocase protein TatB|nr:twin-arginine translocase subunit TatB [Rhodospirillaceae bacterium]